MLGWKKKRVIVAQEACFIVDEKRKPAIANSPERISELSDKRIGKGGKGRTRIPGESRDAEIVFNVGVEGLTIAQKKKHQN